MKNTLLVAVCILSIILSSLTPVSAGFRNGPPGNSPNCQGPHGQARQAGGPAPAELLAGTPFEYTGDVISLVPGMGLELATATGNITVYGIGPLPYWEELGIERPVIGDTITVSGFTVSHDGAVLNILFTLAAAGEIVQLRDQETGLPLWRRPWRDCPGEAPAPPLVDITQGTPFEFQGELSRIRHRRGLAITISTGEEVVVYGQGPAAYWEELGVDRPAIGDQVVARGFTVEYHGKVRNILVALIINGVEVQLRDPETGAPLWSRHRCQTTAS